MLHSLSHLVAEYTEFFVFGKKVEIPYTMVQQPGESLDPTQHSRTPLNRHFAGKGTPRQILETLSQTAALQRFDLGRASGAEIHDFMMLNGIGVDCSGFVYNVLDTYWRERGLDLTQHIRLFPGLKGFVENWLHAHKRVRRCSAHDLTSELNTEPVVSVKKIIVGDVIRLSPPTWRGKHVAVVTEVSRDLIVYAHSSERSQQKGPHLATIEVTDPEKGLAEQGWLEKTSDGRSYCDFCFHPEKGDGARRFKFV